MSLYKAELRRLNKRRFIRVLLLGVVLVFAATAVGTYLTSEKIGASQQAAADRDADNDYQQSLKGTADFRAQCVKAKADPKSVTDATQFPPDCSEITDPQRSDFDSSWHLPPTFSFAKKFPDMLLTFAALMALAAFVVGASFAGAEWSSGGVSNLLLRRPQRLRVLNTKLAALLTWLTGITVVLGEAWIGAFYLVAHQHGDLLKMTPGAWRSTELAGLRALALVLVAAAAGFALAMIGRHTAVALGAAVGVVVVLQFGLGTVLSLAKVKFAEAYLLPFWVLGWLRKSYEIEDSNHCLITPTDPCKYPTYVITWHHAGYGLAGIFVVLIGVALWTFRKRDIT